MSDPQIEIAKEWLSEQHGDGRFICYQCGSGDGRICAHTLEVYIGQLEAELEKAKAESERLEELERSYIEVKNEHGVRTFTGIRYGYQIEAQRLREALDEDIEMEEEPHE